MGSASFKKQQKQDSIWLIDNIISTDRVTRSRHSILLVISFLSSVRKQNLIQVRFCVFSDEDRRSEGVLHSCFNIRGSKEVQRVDLQEPTHVDIFHPRPSTQPTLVPEVSLDFSSFRDSCSPLRGSLAAVSRKEKSRKTLGTRVPQPWTSSGTPDDQRKLLSHHSAFAWLKFVIS